jgi:hypothetical protein
MYTIAICLQLTEPENVSSMTDRHEVGAQFPVPYSLFLPNYVHT